jgi:hypothetical protein
VYKVFKFGLAMEHGVAQVVCDILKYRYKEQVAAAAAMAKAAQLVGTLNFS